MCGIFGYLHGTEITGLNDIKINHILPHRGPDDNGWLLYDGQSVLRGKSNLPNSFAKLLLIHKRLSILDLSDLAAQPMQCHNERYYLIFNGEIYNYAELRAALMRAGHTFTSKSDSEVLLNAYIEWGPDCLSKLIGMFALVIFDRQLDKLFFARDPFGIKPFYFYQDSQKFLFGSEIKSLVPFLSANKINSERLFFYLRSGLSDFGDQTLFENIRQLPPGHMGEIQLNDLASLKISAYWQPSISCRRDLSFKEAAVHLRELFLKSIELHLRSDVSFAATLSGGIDSSAIVMSIRHLYPSLPIHTYSYIAEEPSLNESAWINIVNNAAGATSHKVYANSENLIDQLEQLIRLQDEPFGSTSIYAQHRVFQAAASNGVKVMLDGQGADEMLGGYQFYQAARFVSLLKKYKFAAAYELLKTCGNSTLTRSLGYLLPLKWQMKLRQLSQQPYVPTWLNRHWLQNAGINYLPAKQKYGREVLQEELLHTFSHSSLPMLLRYEDRNSMAYSIESRVPFLTTQIVEFIFSLPEEYIIAKDGLTKAVFREAMRDIVPQTILDRRDKIGFATPERNWLSVLKPWVDAILTDERTRQIPVFNHEQLINDWQQMLCGKKGFDFRFWRWINFIKWSQIYQIQW